MTTPQITIYDALTSETVTRDLNPDELVQKKLDEAQAKLHDESLVAKQTARQAVLDKLGLTADEANALLG